MGAPRIEVATEEAYLPVFRGHPRIARLWSRDEIEEASERPETKAGGDPLTPARPGAPGTARFHRVLDLQGTLGSRRIAARLGPVASLNPRSLQRRWIVFWGDRAPRPRVPHATERYAEAAGLAGPECGARFRPRVYPTAEERAEGARLAPGAFAQEEGRAIALISGASRRTKEYPGEQFKRLAALLESEGRPIWRIGPPEEGAGGRQEGPILRLPLGPLKALLARAAVVVASDSGPMHLASALGVPVVALFGSSVPGFGFTPTGDQDRILQVEDLPCRPCGVHGKDRCWLGHWRCLRDLAPERVAGEVRDVLRRRFGCIQN